MAQATSPKKDHPFTHTQITHNRSSEASSPSRPQKLRVLLVQPAPFEPGRLGLETVLWMAEPLALAAIAAPIRKEHEVQILDMRLETDQALSDVLREFQPNIVGTTSMTTDCFQAKAILQLAKDTLGSQVVTIVGGHHPTLAPQDFEGEAVDALCIGEGEDTFSEFVNYIVEKGQTEGVEKQVTGLRVRTADGTYRSSPPRLQTRDINELPPPARDLIPERYKKDYFYGPAHFMASMETSRGCAFRCNFCAIWEFYESKVRFLSAQSICDRLEQMEEKFVFFMDDNFLTNKKRLEQLCEEIERRKIKKYFAVQGRTDFIAKNPQLMARLKKAGLWMVLSGYETNSDDNLEYLRKNNVLENNIKAIQILRDLGIVSTGIFMVRQDFKEADFRLLYKTITEMKITIPAVTILTPLPGTELFRQKEKELLTKDYRLFDLVHSVLPTVLPRQEFYRQYAAWDQATRTMGVWDILQLFLKRPLMFLSVFKGFNRYRKRYRHYGKIVQNSENYLRDELGIIDAQAIAKTDGELIPDEMRKRTKMSTRPKENSALTHAG